MRRFTPLITGLMAALIAALAATSPGLADTPPRSPIALGVSAPQWWDPQAVDDYTTAVGLAPTIWSLWSDWGDTSANSTAPFPTQVLNGLDFKTNGILPQIYWEPLNPSSPFDCKHWSLQKIIKGKHDAYIRQWAQDAKAYGGTVILRFAHEMNGNWYVWGNGVCGNTAGDFRAAWKRVWNIFRGPGGVGATNVKFEYSIINSRHVSADYPGNSYVDYLGLTALDWGMKSKWKSLVDTMTPAMKALKQLSSTKPIIASEIAAGNNPNCAKCDKAAYFSQGYPAVYAKWPQLVAIVYFDYDMRSQGQDDWRLQSPQAALDAYKNIVADPRFQGVVPIP